MVRGSHATLLSSQIRWYCFQSCKMLALYITILYSNLSTHKLKLADWKSFWSWFCKFIVSHFVYCSLKRAESFQLDFVDSAQMVNKFWHQVPTWETPFPFLLDIIHERYDKAWMKFLLLLENFALILWAFGSPFQMSPMLCPVCLPHQRGNLWQNLLIFKKLFMHDAIVHLSDYVTK